MRRHWLLIQRYSNSIPTVITNIPRKYTEVLRKSSEIGKRFYVYKHQASKYQHEGTEILIIISQFSEKHWQHGVGVFSSVRTSNAAVTRVYINQLISFRMAAGQPISLC